MFKIGICRINLQQQYVRLNTYRCFRLIQRPERIELSVIKDYEGPWNADYLVYQIGDEQHQRLAFKVLRQHNDVAFVKLPLIYHNDNFMDSIKRDIAKMLDISGIEIEHGITTADGVFIAENPRHVINEMKRKMALPDSHKNLQRIKMQMDKDGVIPRI